LGPIRPGARSTSQIADSELAAIVRGASIRALGWNLMHNPGSSAGCIGSTTDLLLWGAEDRIVTPAYGGLRQAIRERGWN